ncbi:hypothetical protein ACB092_10G176600 [Castanea dentata]
MKVSGFWVLLLLFVFGTTFLFLNVSGRRIVSLVPDDDGTRVAATSRRLKESGYNFGTDKKSQVGNVNLDDYHPIDPVPSSKTSIRPGPIQHGTPIIPYIPRPSPPAPSPSSPKIGGFT